MKICGNLWGNNSPQNVFDGKLTTNDDLFFGEILLKFPNQKFMSFCRQ